MRYALLALPLLLAACHHGGGSVSVAVTADQASGDAQLKCLKSSSGTCYAALISAASAQALEAKVGAATTAHGIGWPVKLCVDTAAVEPAHCETRDLVQGEQVVQVTKLH